MGPQLMQANHVGLKQGLCLSELTALLSNVIGWQMLVLTLTTSQDGIETGV